MVMRYFIAVVHKDKRSAYGVHFPDVPGCHSAADDMDALIPNAIEALGLFAEDAELPVPRGIDLIKSDPEVAEELSEGAFLIAVPFIENDQKVVRTNISIELGILKAIDAAAKSRKMTRSAFLAQAARHEIER